MKPTLFSSETIPDKTMGMFLEAAASSKSSIIRKQLAHEMFDVR